MNKLQTALLINAVFSCLSGIVLILANQSIARLFGLTDPTAFWITGCVLVFFAATIGYEIYRQRSFAVLWIITQDMLWVVGSIVLLIWNPFGISQMGLVLIGMVAAIVFYMALIQSRALARIDDNPDKQGKRWQFERIVKADKVSVWKLISDVGQYDLFAPNIDAVSIISGDGLGMARSCAHGKDSWSETCTLWEEEKAYSFKVDTTAPDYPYPFTFLEGFWSVEEIDKITTKIVMRFAFQYKHSFQDFLLHPFFRTKFFRIAETLLDNWQGAVEKKR